MMKGSCLILDGYMRFLDKGDGEEKGGSEYPGCWREGGDEPSEVGAECVR